MNHAQARVYAEWLLEQVRPVCAKVKIGGGLSRGKEDVHDIEIVCMPFLDRPRAEFGQKKIFNTRLDEILDRLEFMDGALKRVKGGEKYKQYQTQRWAEFGYSDPINPFHVEFWIVTPPASWGVQLMIRTGPAEFSQYMVTQKSKRGALPDQYHVKDGAVWEGVIKLDISTEQEYFALCKMRYLEPSKRMALWGRG